jgi:Mitochondrial ribosomal protein (VAR1)
MLIRLSEKEIINLDNVILRKKHILSQIKEKKLNVEPYFFKENDTNLIKSSTLLTDYSLIKQENDFYDILNNININENKNSVNKSNEVVPKIKINQLKIDQTLSSLKNSVYNRAISNSVYLNPVSMLYYIKNKPQIHHYLKSMSNYNRSIKGIVLNNPKINVYNFDLKKNNLLKNMYEVLAYSFKAMYCLISKPVFFITSDKLIIQLFYFLFIPNILKFKLDRKIHKRFFKKTYRFRKLYKRWLELEPKKQINFYNLSYFNIKDIYPKRFDLLCNMLSNLFNKSIELSLIRLHYPYNDSNILASLLGAMIKKIKFRIMVKRLFRKAVIRYVKKFPTKNRININIIPAFLSGLSIRIGGRLMTHKIVPRMTVKFDQRGALARGKVNFYNVARVTKKNKRGAFSITISEGQNFFNV